MKKTVGILFKFVLSPLLFFGGIPIWLSFLAGKPFWGLVAAILSLLGFYTVFAFGARVGAEQALRNPPPPGETWVQVILGDTVLIKSKKFPFAPQSQTNQPENPTPFSLSLPQARHRAIWRKIREDHQKGLSPSQILIKHKLDIHEDTLRTIIKEGESGKWK